LQAGLTYAGGGVDLETVHGAFLAEGVAGGQEVVGEAVRAVVAGEALGTACRAGRAGIVGGEIVSHGALAALGGGVDEAVASGGHDYE
jgi:hypothetical protein